MRLNLVELNYPLFILDLNFLILIVYRSLTLHTPLKLLSLKKIIIHDFLYHYRKKNHFCQS